MADEVHATVAVAVRDRREEMLRCLDAILAQDQASGFEVVVADNGSTDGTPEAVMQRAAGAAVPVRVVRAEGLVGAARNAAVREARGEIVAFTDSDCRPGPGWLRTGLVAFSDPRLGVATGPTVPAEPPPYEPWHATIEIRRQTWRFETCNAFFRRDALLAVGGFDESLTMWEDAAAGWALLDAGWTTRFLPDAVVRHDVTYPGWGWHVRRAARYGQCAAVVRGRPNARGEILRHGLFLGPRDARLLAALAGLAAAPRSRAAALLAMPYVLSNWRGLATPGAQGGW